MPYKMVDWKCPVCGRVISIKALAAAQKKRCTSCAYKKALVDARKGYYKKKREHAI